MSAAWLLAVLEIELHALRRRPLSSVAGLGVEIIRFSVEPGLELRSHL
jgi:hypothetical protein